MVLGKSSAFFNIKTNTLFLFLHFTFFGLGICIIITFSGQNKKHCPRLAMFV